MIKELVFSQPIGINGSYELFAYRLTYKNGKTNYYVTLKLKGRSYWSFKIPEENYIKVIGHSIDPLSILPYTIWFYQEVLFDQNKEMAEREFEKIREKVTEQIKLKLLQEMEGNL